MARLPAPIFSKLLRWKEIVEVVESIEVVEVTEEIVPDNDSGGSEGNSSDAERNSSVSDEVGVVSQTSGGGAVSWLVLGFILVVTRMKRFRQCVFSNPIFNGSSTPPT